MAGCHSMVKQTRTRTPTSRRPASASTSGLARARRSADLALDADVMDSPTGVLGDHERRLAALERGDAPEHEAFLLLDASRTRDGRPQMALLQDRLLNRPLDALGVEDLLIAAASRGATGD